MKYISTRFICIILFLLFGLSVDAQKNDEGRVKIAINNDWKFTLNSSDNFASINTEDSGWVNINLPHTWNKEDAFDENKEYYRGNGFYRKNIYLNPEWKNKKVFIYFEGANQETDIYLNEVFIGHHNGGYTAFAFDITSQLSFENENLLAVKINNEHNKNIPPLNADFTFYGGIYRDVYLIITDPVHIDVLNYASPGVFIDTPELSKEKAKVRIWQTIINETDEPAEVEIKNKIFDENNYEAALITSTLTIQSHSKEIIRQMAEIENPELWSPDSPYLYKVVTEIYKEDVLVDKIENPLGLRWFSFNSDSGFYLNDKPIKLSGTNRHQDYEGLGNAVSNDLQENDLRIIKDNGFNFLRLAHYPQDPSVLNAADETGLIIWEEIPIVNMITMSNMFYENCRSMLREMVRQHYNHPSILMWGYMNEIMLRKPEEIPDGYYEAIVNLAKELEQIVKEEDNTRPTVMAISSGEIENKTGIDNVTDILGMNLYYGWYYENIESLGVFLDGYHKRNPYRPIIISEYGAGSDERIHTFNPKAYEWSTEYQQIYHEKTFPQILERNFVIGSAVWNQFDFGSNHRQDTKPLINQKGLYYFKRIPKDISYYYMAKLSAQPVLHIAADDWTNRAGYNNETMLQPIKIYTNLDSISVYKDDLYLGDYIPVNSVITLKQKLNEGKNKIRVEGKFAGKIIKDSSDIFFTDIESFFKNPLTKTIAINIGSDFEYLDKENNIWIPCIDSISINCKIAGGIPVITHNKIFNSIDEPVFQTAIEGIEFCKIKVPNGKYEVQIFLSEIKLNEIGERIFSISVNEIPFIYNLDLIKDYGKHKAIILRKEIIVDNEKGIEINFRSEKGNSLLNGIKLKR